MGLATLCETIFGSTDLYSILNIPKTSSEKEVRKAYHKISLVWHPDRVSEDLKAEATEKFKVLSKIYLFLSDPEKRTVYDESGFMEDGDDDKELEQKDWISYWRSLFGQVTTDDINKYEAEYKGGDEELADLVHAYEKSQGDFDKMCEYILFHTIEDEDRIRRRLQELIDRNELPAYESFTNESQAKRDRRARKLRKEAKEAEKFVKKNEEKHAYEDLRSAILSKEKDNCLFLDALEKKYAGPKMTSKTSKKSSRGKKK